MLRDFGVSLSEIYTSGFVSSDVSALFKFFFYLTRFIFVFGFTDNDKSNYFICFNF